MSKKKPRDARELQTRPEPPLDHSSVEPLQTREEAPPLPPMDVPPIEPPESLTSSVMRELAYPCPLCFNTLKGQGQWKGQKKSEDVLYLYCDRCPHSWAQTRRKTRRVNVVDE